MNNRFALIGALTLLASAAHASLTMVFDEPNLTTVLPAAPTQLVFTGTLTKDEMSSGQWGFTLAFPGLPSNTDFLQPTIDLTEIVNWLESDDPVFAGELFRINVLPTSQIGMHDYNSLGPDNMPFFMLNYTGVTGKEYDTGFVSYTVNILPVPEPATLGMLALGGLAVLRRRKKS